MKVLMENKNIIAYAAVCAAIAGLLFSSVPAVSAATLNAEPMKLTVATGEEVRVVVNVVPGVNERDYTAQVEMRYDPELFEFKTISYGNKWISVIRPVYDEAGFGNNSLVKTAGYPGGFTKPEVFGVATFIAKKSGTGTITFGDNSFVLDAYNNNTLVGATIPSVVSVSTVGPDASGPGYALASIISFGEFSNTTTFIAVFLFLVILYIVYLAVRPRRDEEEE